ncbi:MAG: multiple sugar transport system substrate-binding protein [Microbacteriaceae bacterium]|nr:multiple sugar transport system substrate-binding protein [Microbacteriaceae bacterium]
MKSRRGVVAAIAAIGLTVALAGCETGPSKEPTSTAGSKSITVWSLEEQPDRLAKAQTDADAFTAKTGIKVKLVGVNEDQFPQLITAAAAAGKLPDVVGALPLSAVRTMSGNDLVNTTAAASVIKDLGSGTFSKAALDLTRQGSKQLAVPSDGFPLSVIYRKDLFAKAGLPAPKTYADILTAAKKLNGPDMAGFVAGDSPSTGYTQQVFEFIALANGCDLVNGSGKVTLSSKACVDAFDFYGNLVHNYSVPGAMDSTSTKTTYMGGKAAITVWASFILDEMAGLVNDAKPTCPECAADPQFIAKNSGFVTSIQGPDAKQAVSGGDVTSWVITSTASAPSATKFVEYFMDEGYLPWLSQAPEGKFPTRLGTAADSQKFVTGWKGLETGVTSKAKLADVYPADVLAALQKGVGSFTRWGFTQGQGNLVGAVLTELPIPKAIGALANGEVDGKGAAAQAQQAVQAIQDSSQ